MVVAMNNHHHLESTIPAQIDLLCDLVPNKKRPENDFIELHKCLKQFPKECTPFRGKILQHLQAHAYNNPDANLSTLSSCYARAILLFRKTPNKSEGPLGAWKSGLLDEIVTFERHLDELYKIVGINSSSIVKLASLDEDEDLESKEKLTEEKADYENIINDHLIRINSAAHNISALLSVNTDFDIPAPIYVLLKLAAKAGLLRWKDHKKRPNGPLRCYVYSLSPYLINLNLMLFKSIISVAGSSIIPFISFINQCMLRILEWTRTSNLSKHDENLFHLLRLNLFKMISFIIDQLSLNINLEPQQLKVLLEVELVDNLEELVISPSDSVSVRDEHVVEALNCLDNLILVYQEFLEQPLELKVKTYVIQTCLKIYRNFEVSFMSLTCRKGLLRLLQTIANQPYATSTTEIAYHIFELARKLEKDPEMRSMTCRSLNVALAHKPTIVTHYDVYDCYSRPMLAACANASESDSVEKMISESTEQLEVDKDKPMKEKSIEQTLEPSERSQDEEMSVVESDKNVQKESEQNGTKTVEHNYNLMQEPEIISQVEREVENAPAVAAPAPAIEENNVVEKVVKEPEKQQMEEREEENKDKVEDENEVQTYMSYFVERLA